MNLLNQYLMNERLLIDEGLHLIGNFASQLEARQPVPASDLRLLVYALGSCLEHISEIKRLVLPSLKNDHRRSNDHDALQTSSRGSLLLLRAAIDLYERNPSSTESLIQQLSDFTQVMSWQVDRDLRELECAEDRMPLTEKTRLLDLTQSLESAKNPVGTQAVRQIYRQLKAV